MEMRSLFASLKFPRARRAFGLISPSFLWYFAIFARSESVLAEQILWLLLAFAALATHIDGTFNGRATSEWSRRLDALAHLYLGVGALCVSQGIRRAYGGWVSICLALTPPPPLLWVVDIRTVRSLGLCVFTTIDLFLQSNHGRDLHSAAFVLFLYALRIYVQPTSNGRFSPWRALMASLLLSKQIDDAKRWMMR